MTIRASDRWNPSGISRRTAAAAVSLFLAASAFAATSPSASSSSAVLNGSGNWNLLPSSLRRRSMHGLRSDDSDPLRSRIELLRRQISDHAAVAATYAAYARKLKLESSKQVRLFADLSWNYSVLLSTFPTVGGGDDENVLRALERGVKDRIRATRQLVSDAKEAFDNQLKIQKLKDTIFAVNEQLSKAKKQGAFSSLIAAKSIPKSLHCLA